jgi:flagellar motor component MotA
MNKNDFEKEYHFILERALSLSEKACKEGLLALLDLIDENKVNQRDIFEYGLYLVIEAQQDDEFIDKILTNIVELETDTEKKLLKNIQKEAVFAMYHGLNPGRLLLLLSSYVDIDTENTMKRYKELDRKELMEYIEKENQKKPFRFWKNKR